MATKTLDKLAAETKVDAGIDKLIVELIPGVDLGVLAPKMWRLSAFRKLRTGDVDGWAEECLATAVDVQVLIATNPTMEQFEAFADAINEAADARGKSRE